jgi:hypothetical protein
MARILGAVIVSAFLFMAWGCGSPLTVSPRPAVLSELTLLQKQQYISNATSTLKNFLASAQDSGSRRQFSDRKELALEVNRYVELRVDPIVHDVEAGEHPETRLEVAKLQFLCAKLYLALGENLESWEVLREMERRYADQPDVLQAALDPRELGFDNLGDGIRTLKKRVFHLPFSTAAS